MHSPVQAPLGRGGIAEYLLSPNEEWTVKAMTCTFDMTNAQDDDATFLEARAPNGAVIYRQFLYFVHQTTFISAAFGAEPWDASDQGTVGWPQQDLGSGEMVTERLAPLTLTPNCALYVYATLGAPDLTTDPLSNPDTGVLVKDVTLWVEDAHGVDASLLNPGTPILLGIGG